MIWRCCRGISASRRPPNLHLCVSCLCEGKWKLWKIVGSFDRISRGRKVGKFERPLGILFFMNLFLFASDRKRTVYTKPEAQKYLAPKPKPKPVAIVEEKWKPKPKPKEEVYTNLNANTH